jgi:DNA-binding transcriptional regulator YbjK
MRQTLAIGLLCGALGACAPMGGPPGAWLGPPPRASLAPPPPASRESDLQRARQACNTAYPPQIGNYLAHADCVNEAIERYAVAASPHPDLVRLQEQVRSQISARIDQKTISAHDGEQQMTEADRAITAAQRERDAAHKDAADQHVARVEAMLSE